LIVTQQITPWTTSPSYASTTTMRTILDEHVAVETRLGFQGEACRAAEQRLWLRPRQIGQEQCKQTPAHRYGDVFGAPEPVTRTLGRKVNPTVYTAAEFSKRARTENAFVTQVLEQQKLWVIGSEDDQALELVSGASAAPQLVHARVFLL
jgi:hypothetical protein